MVRRSLLDLAAVVVLSGGLAGCLRPAAAPCGDGYCPDDFRCVAGATGAECRAADCARQPDGTPCADSGEAMCMAGACVIGSCGDGMTSGDEECDEGALNGTGGQLCHADCKLGVCGDGEIDQVPGVLVEGCDQGAAMHDDHGADTCHVGCIAPVCDDGIVDSGEADGCLAAPTVDTSVPAPDAIAAADLDADGAADLILAAVGETALTVRWGGSAPVLATLALPAPAEAILPRDLDGDGLVDLVVPLVEGADLVVVHQTGARSFAAPVTIALGAPLAAGDAGDVDRDGRADLLAVVKHEAGSALELRRGVAGPEVFGAPEPLGPLTARGLFVADLNDDEVPDLMILRLGIDDLLIEVHVNDGNGSFAAPVVSSGIFAVLALTDLDGDALPDLVVTSGDPLAPARVRKNLGDGRFAASTALPQHESALAAAASDVDSDGLPELFLVAGGTELLLLHNDTNLDFSLSASVDLPGAAATLAGRLVVGDLDGDGFVEAAVGGSDLRLVDTGDGPLGQRRLVVPLATSVAAARGPMDASALAVAVSDGELWSWMLARAPRAPERLKLEGVYRVAAGDLDGDGHADAVAQLIDGTLVVFGGDGTGALVERQRLSESGLYLPMIADATGDGVADLVVHDLGLLVVRAGGGLVLGPRFGSAPTDGAHGPPGFVDLDDDGLPEAIRRAGDQVVSYQNLGSGVFAEIGTSLLSSSTPFLLADVRPGGVPEIVDTRVAPGPGPEERIVRVFERQSTGEWLLLGESPIGRASSSPYAGDFDADGVVDLLFASPDGTDVCFGRGDLGFAPAATVGGFHDEIALVDADGDGHTDLLATTTTGALVRFGRRTPATP